VPVWWSDSLKGTDRSASGNRSKAPYPGANGRVRALGTWYVPTVRFRCPGPTLPDMAEPTANIRWHAPELSREERWARAGQQGATVWFTGLSGSGKSTVAAAVERALFDAGQVSYLLDGDNVRYGLNAGLGFSPEDRDENVRRLSEAAALFADAGVVCLVSAISPYRHQRAAARAAHERGEVAFIEVWVATPIEECERRDPKGLYRKARSGEITGFTGIDAPYEAPEAADLVIGEEPTPLEVLVERVVGLLAERGIVSP
jgi:adenylyl-sulfate kinase